MRWIALLVFTSLAFSADLVLPADVVLDSAVDYTSIPHGKLAMDIVRPKAPGSYPGVILIHGGGFSAGSRASYLPMAVKLAQAGFVAATIDYQLTPMFQFPAPIYNAKAAVRFLRAHAAKYGVDKEHMAVIGESAGATWAQFMAVTRGMPQFEGNGGSKDE